ncbi:hypothetical protein GQF61_10300 [Sphingobacterium sp. DK4209]|uniref:Tryptophan-rich sensory protein n=1 Tax=Sphingobacterium zhuxiongii TaxID=2662364 RepID=A0A5Q0Q679_9SPHI|nr:MULTISPECIES: hypothetical protein [unclassified Sphingobacterium]MVZ66249.1 hypothetical protein [Sphingobacterium sp. DK4209]QGA24973.1 hypothetical protein GFH32_00935 [Sphingobacterium sp. dk4302]
MQDSKKMLAYVSLILNLTYYGYWIYCGQFFTSFEAAKEQFSKIPIFGHFYWDIIFFIATLFSLIVFSRRNGVLNKLFVVLQTLFAFGYLWSNL